MLAALEQFAANTWNRSQRLFKKELTGGRRLGFIVHDGRVSEQPYFVPFDLLLRHLWLIGLSGVGKSWLILYFIFQDLMAGRAVIVFSPHNDLIPFCLKVVAYYEKQSGQDQSSRLILVEPANPLVSVGLNVLSTATGHARFARIADITSILREKFDLKTLGPRSEELARNVLYAASEAGLTIVDVPNLLTYSAYLGSLLKDITNDEVRSYFENRFLPLSDSMKATVRDPLLNKVAEFVSDPAFRHALGQTVSTFSWLEALDNNISVLVDVNKPDTGKQGAAVASLFFKELQSAIFKRKSRAPVSIYLDEVQNLVAADADLETLFVESRKFGCSICVSHQLLSQLPTTLRAAVQGAATRVFFQLSGDDAEHVARWLDSGQGLAQRLKNLPPRHFIVKSAHYPVQEVRTATLPSLDVDYRDLVNRSRAIYARRRDVVESEIRARRPQATIKKEVFDAWE